MFALHTAVAGCLVSAFAFQAGPQSLPQYWPAFPHPKTLCVTGDIDDLPRMSENDPGGVLGDMAFMLQSLSGLMALAVEEGRSDKMLWVDMPKSVSQNRWREDVLKFTNAQREDIADPYALLREAIEKDIVDGYILYRRDTSHRQPYEEPDNEKDYRNSVNAATSLAALLNAVIVEGEAEPKLRELGLECVMDVRDKDEQWVFDHYRDQLSRETVCIIDPKVPHMRAYSVATKSLCVFRVSPTTDQVLKWLEPNAPVVGWNAGDEYRQTSQLSLRGHYQTASNWVFNAPAMTTVRAGADVPWNALRVNEACVVDPLALDWPDGAHYTSFVLSDGDNVQWFVGNFLDNDSYWKSPSRTMFPMCYTAPVSDLSQMNAAAMAYLAATQSANDYLLSFGGGYYYPDEYARDLPNRRKIIEERIDQYARRMAALGIRALIFISRDWDSPESIEFYTAVAERVPGLVGVLAIQYHPYNAGSGEVLWVDNAEGSPIPVLSARYALWAHLSQLENNGPPALVAARINEEAAAERPGQAVGIDWTIVHAWSFFQKADTTGNLLAEEIPPGEEANNPEARRGVEPVKWCVDRLAPHVRVVNVEELLWRLRLTEKPRETLDALAGSLASCPATSSERAMRLDEYRAWLRDAPAPEAAAAEAIKRLQALRLGLQ